MNPAQLTLSVQIDGSACQQDRIAGVQIDRSINTQQDETTNKSHLHESLHNLTGVSFVHPLTKDSRINTAYSLHSDSNLNHCRQLKIDDCKLVDAVGNLGHVEHAVSRHVNTGIANSQYTDVRCGNATLSNDPALGCRQVDDSVHKYQQGNTLYSRQLDADSGRGSVPSSGADSRSISSCSNGAGSSDSLIPTRGDHNSYHSNHIVVHNSPTHQYRYSPSDGKYISGY